jgi:hypothetical protein
MQVYSLISTLICSVVVVAVVCLVLPDMVNVDLSDLCPPSLGCSIHFYLTLPSLYFSLKWRFKYDSWNITHRLEQGSKLELTARVSYPESTTLCSKYCLQDLRFARRWLWRMPSSRMWRRVNLVWTDVSEECVACSRWFLAHGFYYPEDGGDMFLRNVGSYKIYMAPHPRRRHS